MVVNFKTSSLVSYVRDEKDKAYFDKYRSQDYKIEYDASSKDSEENPILQIVVNENTVSYIHGDQKYVESLPKKGEKGSEYHVISRSALSVIRDLLDLKVLDVVKDKVEDSSVFSLFDEEALEISLNLSGIVETNLEVVESECTTFISTLRDLFENTRGFIVSPFKGVNLFGLKLVLFVV